MTPCTCHPGNVCASAASCAAARRVEFGANMTTPQPAALPELQDFGPWHVSHDGKYIDSDNFNHDVKLVVQGDFRNDEQRRSYSLDIAKRLSRPALAALQSQPAAAGVSDRVVKALLAQALFFKEGAHTVASLEADIRAILALRPRAVPMTDERLAEVLTTAYGSPEWTMDDVRAARSVEAAALGITAQGAQGGEG